MRFPHSPRASCPWLQNLLLISLLTLLTACGGGGSSSDTGSSSSSSSGSSSNSSSTGGSSSSSSTSSGGTSTDRTPDSFSFPAKDGAEPGATYLSNTVVISGINVPVPVKVTNGEYSLSDGSGEFTSESGEISKDQQLTLRAKAPDEASASKEVEVTVGEGEDAVSAKFIINTIKDSTAPSAAILFPPTVAMTEGETILVRGTAADDLSTITSVQVNGVEATATDENGLATWQAVVSLAPGADTTLTVSTRDAAGNTSSDAAQVTIRRGNITQAFPDSDYDLGSPFGVALDRLSGRNRLLVVGGGQTISSIDLSTGERNSFFQIPIAALQDPKTLGIHETTGRVYVGGGGEIAYIGLADTSKADAAGNPQSGRNELSVATGLNDRIVAVERETGRVSLVASDLSNFEVVSYAADSVPDTDNPIGESAGIAYDSEHSRYLVTDCATQEVFSVDAEDGRRESFSSTDVGEGAAFSPEGCLAGIAVDTSNHRAIVSDYGTGQIFSLNLDNGNRRVLSETSDTNSLNPLQTPAGLAVDEAGEYVFVADESRGAVMAVDLVTGHRVLISN